MSFHHVVIVVVVVLLLYCLKESSVFHWRSCQSVFSYEGRVFVETGLGELFEALGEIATQRRRGRLGNMEEHSHWMHVRVGRLPLGQLDGRDAQRPDVSLEG